MKIILTSEQLFSRESGNFKLRV